MFFLRKWLSFNVSSSMLVAVCSVQHLIVILLKVFSPLASSVGLAEKLKQRPPLLSCLRSPKCQVICAAISPQLK